jgi:HEAT repeat protein
MQHDPETIATLLEILQRHTGETSTDEQTRAAIAISLARCDVPEVNYWLLAFQSQRMDQWLSDETTITPNNNPSLEDRAAEVCMRLVQSVQSPDANIAKLSLRLLRELNINNTLTLFPELSSDQRLRIGRVLMQIDPETLDTVRDGLRHAVMRRRLEAIEFAQTLGLVDLMIEPFTVIVKNDHQSVRLAAASAMGAAVSDASAELLRELSASPHGSLRETAIEALHRRGITV